MPKTAHTRATRLSGKTAAPRKSSRNKKTARLLSRRLVYSGPAFWVTSDRIIEPSGVQVLREVVRHPGSVVILATFSAPARQLCFSNASIAMPPRAISGKLPAGRIDKGERALPAAKRELLEETGYTAGLEANPEILRESRVLSQNP